MSAQHLADLLRDLQHDQEVLLKPAEFRRLLASATERAEALETELSRRPASPRELSQRLNNLARSCKRCHARFRN